ncbi:M23 family metallopeptidase [Kordia algicida OT-1]|uniref:Peptidase M23B n=1 Tax=Kordia algicida OT-1 TaxID=391587 RepID=A9EDK4_9FLAO|nr:M23 family metallopeptidase [Kordia algicida]EDP94244.1 peptidase M23B [Kordia algicida OT-1]
MKTIVFFLFFSVSLSYAQQVQFERDSTLTTKDTLFFSIKNNMLSPMFFIMNPKENIPKEIQYQRKTLLKPSEKQTHFVKVPRNMLEHDSALVDFNKYFSFKVGYGDPNTAKHTDDYLYLLPYKKKRKLIQGNFGRFSHDHIRSFHAFDFGTKIGDTIYAAREGKVVMTKESSKKYGRTRKFANFANYIIIQHDDGTTAAYYHLKFEGVLIEKGDLVKRGQAIGISGMTGFTTTPHLHFVVHTTSEEKGNISVPIQFEGYVGKKFRKGKKYKRRK